MAAPEAHWRLMSLPFVQMTRTIHKLAVHDERGGAITFNPDEQLDVEERLQNPKQTQLMGYFAKCSNPETTEELTRMKAFDPEVLANTLLYDEFNTYYSWNPKKREWTRRQRRENALGEDALSRIYTVNPSKREPFAIRALLLNRRGPTSFKDLRTVNGTEYVSFHEAAEVSGIFESGDLWMRTLAEAAGERMGYRHFMKYFVVVLLSSLPPNPRELFDAFLHDLVPVRPDQTPEQQKQRALERLEYYLSLSKKTCL